MRPYKSKTTVFGNHLRRLRRKHRLTQEEMAEKIGISRATIGHLESGRREPLPGMIVKICRALHVPSDYMLGLVDDYVEHEERGQYE